MPWMRNDATGNRKKARVSLEFKQKVLNNPVKFEETQRSIPTTDLMFDEDDGAEALRVEMSECERYFLKKIQVYFDNFKEERDELKEQIIRLESDLEECRSSQLSMLLKMRELKNKIVELEGKNQFYKNKLRKCDSNLPG